MIRLGIPDCHVNEIVQYFLTTTTTKTTRSDSVSHRPSIVYHDGRRRMAAVTLLMISSAVSLYSSLPASLSRWPNRILLLFICLWCIFLVDHDVDGDDKNHQMAAVEAFCPISFGGNDSSRYCYQRQHSTTARRGRSTSTLLSSSSWSKFVENCSCSCDDKTPQKRYKMVDTIIQDDDESFQAERTIFLSPGSTVIDVSSARDWLEWCERNSDGHGGVYTVIRCDFPLSTLLNDISLSAQQIVDNDRIANYRWKIWGLDFHLRRLQESYLTSLDASACEKVFQTAIQSTYEVMNLLLEEASEEIKRRKSGTVDPSSVITVMLTILWQPATAENVMEGDIHHQQDLHVFGHAFSSMKSSPAIVQQKNPNPSINAAVGRLPYEVDVKHDKLPNRYQHHPEAKMSSWCRQRRPLEELFKSNQAKHNIGEVILTRVDDDTTLNTSREKSVSLLEGLTSNLFVVYDNNVIRTPPCHLSALEGYARHLVLKHAQQCGYTVEEKPIRLDDDHVRSWKEVFITSSIRLIIPVRSVFDSSQGENGSLQLEKIWEFRDQNDPSRTASELASDKLYVSIMGTKY